MHMPCLAFLKLILLSLFNNTHAELNGYQCCNPLVRVTCYLK